MADPSIVGGYFREVGTTTGTTENFTVNPDPGDIMWLGIITEDSTTVTATATGYTLVETVVDTSGGDMRFFRLKRVADGSETSFTFSLSANVYTSVGLTVVRGGDEDPYLTATLKRDSPGMANARRMPGFTTTHANTLAVGWSVGYETGPTTAVTGWSEPTGSTAFNFYRTVASASTVAEVTISGSATRWVGHVILLADTGGGGAPNQGAATGAISWVGSTTGARTSAGAATGAIGWAGSATGARVSAGASTGAISWAGTATGEAPDVGVNEGEAIGTITWAGSATGTRASAGSASGVISWSGAATGVRTPKGAASGSIGWVGSATGARASAGSATGAIDWAGTATGEAPTVGDAVGSASGAITWAGAATGARPSAGSASGTIAWVGSATGLTAYSGAALGAITWIGTVTGASGGPNPLVRTGPLRLRFVTVERELAFTTPHRDLTFTTPERVLRFTSGGS